MGLKDEQDENNHFHPVILRIPVQDKTNEKVTLVFWYSFSDKS